MNCKYLCKLQQMAYDNNRNSNKHYKGVANNDKYQ